MKMDRSFVQRFFEFQSGRQQDIFNRVINSKPYLDVAAKLKKEEEDLEERLDDGARKIYRRVDELQIEQDALLLDEAYLQGMRDGITLAKLLAATDTYGYSKEGAPLRTLEEAAAEDMAGNQEGAPRPKDDTL